MRKERDQFFSILRDYGFVENHEISLSSEGFYVLEYTGGLNIRCVLGKEVFSFTVTDDRGYKSGVYRASKFPEYEREVVFLLEMLGVNTEDIKNKKDKYEDLPIFDDNGGTTGSDKVFDGKYSECIERVDFFDGKFLYKMPLLSDNEVEDLKSLKSYVSGLDEDSIDLEDVSEQLDWEVDYTMKCYNMLKAEYLEKDKFKYPSLEIKEFITNNDFVDAWVNLFGDYPVNCNVYIESNTGKFIVDYWGNISKFIETFKFFPVIENPYVEELDDLFVNNLYGVDINGDFYYPLDKASLNIRDYETAYNRQLIREFFKFEPHDIANHIGKVYVRNENHLWKEIKDKYKALDYLVID